MNDDNIKLLQKKISELEEILYSIPGNIYWKDNKGNYLGCNYSLANILGLTSPKDIINKTNDDLLTKELADIATNVDIEVLENKRGVTTEELGLNNKGEFAIYQSTKVPVYKNNEVVGLVGSSIDITARIKLEEELKKSKIAAVEANEAKTEFLRNMSHDLRTPFNALLNFSQFLESMETDPEKKMYLKFIVSSANQLYEIINQIFEVVKIEGSKMPVTAHAFNIRDSLENIKQLMMPDIFQKKLDFITSVADDIPSVIVCDEFRIHRILLNLVSNALRFTNQGKITIEAKMISKQLNRITLELNVMDTGSGIPNDKFDYIFGQFNRLSSSYKGQIEGIGLGLYIVKQLVEDLGGKINVESEVGEGSKFSITLDVLSSKILQRTE